jgi:hypothetical protein
MRSQSKLTLSGALESVDDIERGDSLALGVLSVGNRVADDVLKEDLEYTASLLVDQTRDTLDTTTTSETTNSGLGDTLDVVTQLVEGGQSCQCMICIRSRLHCA